MNNAQATQHPEAVRETQIEAALSRLENEVILLGEVAAGLMVRLRPVSVPEDTGSDKGPVLPTSAVPVAETLYGQCRRIEAVRAALSSATHRLEV